MSVTTTDDRVLFSEIAKRNAMLQGGRKTDMKEIKCPAKGKKPGVTHKLLVPKKAAAEFPPGTEFTVWWNPDMIIYKKEKQKK
jgi:hypothetical protein